MFRYFLTFLLLSTYSGSLGVPIEKPIGPISSLLESLADRCSNVFLLQQIKSKVDECKVSVPPYNEQQFVCLMFYDINRQLCDSKLSFTEDNLRKINADLEVETACFEAKSWSVTDIKEVPDYKEKVAQVFHFSIGCVKVCGVADVTSQDANFFCKYFKWGSELLAANATTPPIVQETVTNSNLTAANESKAQTVLIPAHHILDSVDIPPVSNNNNTQNNNEISNVPENSNIGADNARTQNPVTGHLSSQQNYDQEQVPPKQEPEKLLDIEVVTQKKVEPLPASPSVTPSNNAIDRPSASEEEPPKKVEDDETKKELDNSPLKNPKKIPLNEQNNSIDQPDPDYQDSEEGKDPDNDDDNPNDPMLGGELDKPEVNQEIKKSRKYETPMSFVGEREITSRRIERKFYPNTLPDQYATDDDHFFPLFLTGVILVVLLYILYHNKNKVSKVVLGLIVEGRQPGRRRNSRGHAYRRLDTLEQAMSANSAAPPSKIIY